MAQPFMGEIRMFGGPYAPQGWAFCDGSLVNTSSNDALFSLLGTIYGGDGRTTFGLPDLKGRIPIHQGEGIGLTERRIGSKGGAETATIDSSTMAAHTHAWQATTNTADVSIPTDASLATVTANIYQTDSSSNLNAMASNMVANTSTFGTTASSHNNIMPFQVVNFIIALVGIYPTQT